MHLPTPPSTAMPRRTFVRTAIGALATLVAAAPVAGCAGRPPIDEGTLASPALLAVLDRSTVRSIGAAYLSRPGAERDRDALVAAILDDARDWHDEPARAIDALVARDFAVGRVVHPDGWVLALTEARQCALVALATA